MDAFDADALVYASVPGHPLGRRILALFQRAEAVGVPPGVGSLLLLPEVLSMPIRDGQSEAVRALASLLARLELQPVDRTTAELAVALAAAYGLQPIPATHLAAAVQIGADRFITGSREAFNPMIAELEIVHLADLPDPEAPSQPARVRRRIANSVVTAEAILHHRDADRG